MVTCIDFSFLAAYVAEQRIFDTLVIEPFQGDTLFLSLPRGDSVIRLIYELLVLIVKTWNLSKKSFFLLDSPYAYSLLLCAGKVNFNNSLFLVSWHFRDYMAKGKVVFPGEVATLGVRNPAAKSLIKRMSWKVYCAILKLGLFFVARPLFNLRCRLFPMEVYVQEHPYFPLGFSGVPHTYIHHGTGVTSKAIISHSRSKVLSRMDGMENIKGLLMAAGYPAFFESSDDEN